MSQLLNAQKKITAQHFSKAAERYHNHAHVQKQAADILIKSLDTDYGVALDLGCGPFVNSFELKKRCNTVISMDLSPAMLQQQVTASVCADMDNLPFKNNSFDLVFSNFAMQWSSNLPALFQSLYAVLKPGGRAHFSLVADGTLSEMINAFAAVDSKRHINQFVSQNEIEAALKQTAFKRISTSFCHHKVFYETAKEALNSIKEIGANHKVNSGEKSTGLMGKEKYKTLLANYKKEQSQFPVSYHVAYIVIEK